MHFEVTDQPRSDVVYERNNYFLWGLAPTVEVDVRERCPHGVSAVREEQTFVDGVFELFTLGIWSPRSSWYYCLPQGAEGDGS
jgi:hypothetical protein